MKKKYLVLLILGISIIFSTIYYNKKIQVKNEHIRVEMQNNERDNEEGEDKKESKNDVDVDRKEEIARELFDKYLAGISTKKERDNTVKLLTDYKINKVYFVEGDDNKYTVDIRYDIQFTEEGEKYKAGDGMLEDNNWIIDKSNMVDIGVNGDAYFIEKIYQG